MWHEARKQEKKVKEAMVNYQRRAERRREYYDKLVSSVQIQLTSYIKLHMVNGYIDIMSPSNLSICLLLASKHRFVVCFI